MRKLKLLIAACALILGAGQSWAQTDVTSTYLTNAGFDTEADFQSGNVATGGSNQRKAVTGWANSGGDTYTTGAAIGFGTTGQINGASIPSTNADGGTTGGALTLNAAWQSQVWYSQEVTLPAGNYMLKFMVNNVGKNEGWNNDPPLFTFTTSLNTFAGNVNSYPVNTWTEQTINFSLATETTGTIKIGYKSNNTGSGNTPKFVVDYVKAFYNSNYTATLQSAIDRATRLYNRMNDVDLNTAISTAQGVIDAAGTDVAYQATIDAAVINLRSAITTAQAKIVLDGEEDITYLLENADFESSPAITGGICTYAYDCAPNGVNYCQMQQVEGWETVGNDNGKAAGVFAYGSSAWLANKSYTASSVTSSIGENNALALVGAWSGTVRYKQSVTLPAGVYVLTVPVFNSHGGTAISKNLIGFVTDGGTEYLATTTQYPVGSTKTETINFTLEQETTGYISLGYTAAGTGSGNCPKMFIDAITIKYFTADKSALFDEITKAQTYQNVLNNSGLAAAIATAQGVYDNTQALQSAVDAQIAALETAISNALQNIASGTNVTALFVTNNSFEEGNTGWNWNNASDTGVRENSNDTYTTTGVDGNYLFNTWGGSDAKYVKQSLTGLPDGYYVIKALVASDAGVSVTLYAGEGTNDITVSAQGKGVFVEGMAGAVAPTEGALEIGASSTNWYKVDNFQLIYYANEAQAQAVIAQYNLAAALVLLNNAAQAAQDAKAEESALLTQAARTVNPSAAAITYETVVGGSEAYALQLAANQAQGISSTSSIADMQAATAALTTATAAYNAAKPAYERAALLIGVAQKASERLNGGAETTAIIVNALQPMFTNTATTAATIEAEANNQVTFLMNQALLYKTYTLGFEKDQYAPYNNVQGLQLAATATTMGTTPANYTNEQFYNQAVAMFTYSWTTNVGEVDAIYNGDWANSTPNATTGVDVDVPGWSPENGMRQIIGDATNDPGLAYTSAGKALFTWGGTTLTYGAQTGYTLPLVKNTLYKLTFKASGWRDGDMPTWMSVELDGVAQAGDTSVPGRVNDAEGNPFRTYTYYLTPTADNSILKISMNKHFTITDLSMKLAVPEALEISEEATAAPVEKYANVTLTRTLSASYWNTFSVPFDAAIPADWTVKEFDSAIDNVISFKDANEIKAGVPYLVKPAADVTNPAFNGVLVKATEGETKGDGDYKFAAQIYNKNLATDGTVAYLATDGKIKKLTSGSLKGLRAYFIVPASGAPARIAFTDGDATGIGEMQMERAADGKTYDLSGRRVETMKKGIYVVNGKKVVK